MKKILTLLTALCLIGTPALALTTTDQHWDGSGYFESHFVAGDDSVSHFWTQGNYISGELHATDSDDNPYGYGVDTTETKLRSHVENGFIEYKFTKTDNYVPMYGIAGQESYTFIGTDGTGDFEWRTNSNYARLRESNYGWKSNDQIKASGNHLIHHYFKINENEEAHIHIEANADTSITNMCNDHWGSSYKFGKGCGCYTNANIHITNGLGINTFDMEAAAENEINTDTGITIKGPNAYYGVHANFGSEFHFNNFALSAN